MSRELKYAELSGWVDLTYIRLPKGRVSNMAKKDIYVWDLHFFIAVQLKMHAEEDVSASETFAHLQKSRGFFGSGTYICQNVYLNNIWTS